MKSVKIDVVQTAAPHRVAQRMAHEMLIKGFAERIARGSASHLLWANQRR